MKTIGVLTSGGDAPGMNAALRAVVRTGLYNNVRMMGVMCGYDGLINGDIDDLTLSSVADIIHRGGTILKTARSDEFVTKEGFKRALNVIDVFNIDGLVVLGGDGTFKGAKLLADAGIPTIGIPCTIDNDLGYTDYTIGFFTAVETVVEAIGKVRDTSSSHGRANVIEVMGRNCGDIALYSGIAGGAESIIVPEVEFDIDEICEKVIRGRNRNKLHHIIIVAEGVGNPYNIAKEMEEKTNIETKVTVLGYLQRGGTPNTLDRIMGSEMGKLAVELLIEGKSARALGMKCNDVYDIDIDEALKAKNEFNIDMYNTANILSL
ncbi:MAG: 6-phosphofructokinase [Tissierellia bacterium]|nr:6-phosphofructokinase [Tissierellia bacterium]MDD4726047.1 6-phosphofructokinase [Tissierellia bacterium]